MWKQENTKRDLFGRLVKENPSKDKSKRIRYWWRTGQTKQNGPPKKKEKWDPFLHGVDYAIMRTSRICAR